MTARSQQRTTKAVLFVILFIILIFQSLITEAQGYRGKDQNFYRGFVASFGTRSADISSSIGELNETGFTQAGGQIGLIFGNNVLRSKIGLIGYYGSTGNTAGTIDLYETNWNVNVYPLALIAPTALVQPYLTGGVAYDQYKFYGYYINREPGTTNYSQAEAPYLGKIKQINATVGAGIEVHLAKSYDFVHFFSEVRYGKNLSSKASNTEFSDTSIAQQMQIVVGINFGARR